MTYNIRKGISWKLLSVILLIKTLPSFGSPMDSLRTERINGNLFIIHQVDQGETLYAISRRYKVSVPDIISHNPSAKLDLEIGIIIQVPVPKPTVQIDTTGMVSHRVIATETLFSVSRQYQVSIADIKLWNNLDGNELSVDQILYIKHSEKQILPNTQVDMENKITHVLQLGETLYSLSKKYEVDVDDLRNWNNLEENNLSIGQIMIVGEKSAQAEGQLRTIPPMTDTIATDTTLIDVDQLMHEDTTQTSDLMKNIHGYDEIVESGIGEIIPGSNESSKYLGLHRTAKVGTIMKVRNEMNDKIVFVRIIGRIPNTGDNNKVLLKISQAAYESLGIIDPRFRIETSYTP